MIFFGMNQIGSRIALVATRNFMGQKGGRKNERRKSMDIKEIIEERRKLRLTISKLLSEFERKTDMEITGISAKKDEDTIW